MARTIVTVNSSQILAIDARLESLAAAGCPVVTTEEALCLGEPNAAGTPVLSIYGVVAEEELKPMVSRFLDYVYPSLAERYLKQ